jgi:hypothetical protein
LKLPDPPNTSIFHHIRYHHTLLHPLWHQHILVLSDCDFDESILTELHTTFTPAGGVNVSHHIHTTFNTMKDNRPDLF